MELSPTGGTPTNNDIPIINNITRCHIMNVTLFHVIKEITCCHIMNVTCWHFMNDNTR